MVTASAAPAMGTPTSVAHVMTRPSAASVRPIRAMLNGTSSDDQRMISASVRVNAWDAGSEREVDASIGRAISDGRRGICDVARDELTNPR